MKTTKRIMSIILALAITLTLSIQVQTANAAEKLSYTFNKLDRSFSIDEGSMSNYYNYPVFEGDTAGIKKINAALVKEAENHVAKSGYTEAELKEFIVADYKNNGSKANYFNAANTKVMLNNGKTVSIMVTTEWYAGGVANGDFFGLTFNVNTGKKLKVADVLPAKYNPGTAKGSKALRNAIYKKLAKKYKDDPETAQNFLNNYKTKKVLKKMDFYVTKKGKVVVCFRTYDIGYGAMGCLSVTLPGK